LALVAVEQRNKSPNSAVIGQKRLKLQSENRL